MIRIFCKEGHGAIGQVKSFQVPYVSESEFIGLVLLDTPSPKYPFARLLRGIDADSPL